MSEPDDSNVERERGILTSKDEKWLNGESENPTDQKRRCRQGIQLAIKDIKKIIEADAEEVTNFDGIGELFNNVRENTGLNRLRCAKNLIALAFIITNDSIDYSEYAEEVNWHPRETSDSPNSEDRKRASRPPSYDVDEAMNFRAALSLGVDIGKRYVNDSWEHSMPLFKSNVKLYKRPSREDINPPEDKLDFEVVKDVYAGYLDRFPSIETIIQNRSIDSLDEGEISTDEEREDLEEIRRILKHVTVRDVPEKDNLKPIMRDGAAGYIANDIELMVNQLVAGRHQLASDDSDFGYEIPLDEGEEVPGQIWPPSFGRRPYGEKEE